MQKQFSFFERNVQWFALGLGGLFLVYMIFAYVIQTPVIVNVSGKTLGPGEVEQETLEGPVRALKADIANPRMPEIPQKNYVEAFVAAIQGPKQQLALLSPYQFNAIRDVPRDRRREDPNLPLAETAIARLPVPPTPQVGSVSSGRSRVTFPKPDWRPDPKRPNLVQPTVDADVDWWSGSFTISGDQLFRAFDAAFDEERLAKADLTRDEFMQTAIVDVELIRQEVLSGGRFGKEEVIKPLKTVVDAPRPAFPGKKATEFDIMNFLSWTTQHPVEVATPPFYTTLDGDIWMKPGEENDQLIAENRQARIDRKKMSIEQRRTNAEQRRQQQLPSRAPSGGGVLGNGLLGGMPGFRDIPMGPTGGGMPGRVAPPPRMPIAPGPRAPIRRAPAQANMVLQAGYFPVHEQMPDIEIIAHDDTAQAGKTYRYKIRYRLANYIYKASGTIAPPALTNQYYLESPYSGWTKPVTMRAKVESFLARITGEKGSFDVFEWRKGRTIKKTIDAGAGDAVGATGWSVVDVRRTGGNPYVLLMDNAGQIDRRDVRSDSENERYQELLEDALGPEVGVAER